MQPWTRRFLTFLHYTRTIPRRRATEVPRIMRLRRPIYRTHRTALDARCPRPTQTTCTHCKTTSLVTRLVTNQWLVSMSLAKLLAKLLTTRLLTYLLTIFCSAPSAQRAHGVHVTHRSQHGAPRAPQIRGNIQVRRWLRSVPALIHAT